MPDLLKSKKFQAALVGLIVAIAGHYGLDLNSDMLWVILSPILTYIGAQGLADALPGKEKALVEAAYGLMPERIQGVLSEIKEYVPPGH